MPARGVALVGMSGVSWVCRHKRYGAVLALIALALQIALTFGHVHLRGGLPGDSHAAIAKQVRLAHSPQQTPTQIPADNDGYCAICASIFLASNAFAPAPPQLLVPANFQRIDHHFNAAQPVVERPRLAFRSRAPPVA
jgi:hypothetical protein